jgi:hypothetical protein
MDENKTRALNDAIYKKAVGYKSQDIVEEYCVADDGKMEMSKRKVSIKDNAPDIAAAKLIMEWTPADPYADMSIEELEAQRALLIATLGENDKGNADEVLSQRQAACSQGSA